LTEDPEDLKAAKLILAEAQACRDMNQREVLLEAARILTDVRAQPAPHGGSAPSSSGSTMPAEEYRVLALPEDPELQQMELDEAALDGWRLITVDQGRAYLARPSITSSVVIAQ
jgi:hypothetical protein